MKVDPLLKIKYKSLVTETCGHESRTAPKNKTKV